MDANLELIQFSLIILTCSTTMAHTHFKGKNLTHNLHHIYQVYNYDNWPNFFDKYMKTYLI